MILFETKEVTLSCVPQWPSTRLKHNPESTLKPLSLLAGKKLKFTKTLKMSHNSHILGNHFKTWVKREQRIPTNHVKRKRWGYKWHHEFSTVSSSTMVFQNTNTFQYDWYIKQQFDHSKALAFVYMWFYLQETQDEQ